MALSLAAISSALSDLASAPWLEEAFIIAFIGFAFILAHKIGVASVRRPAKEIKLAWTGEEEEEEEEEEQEEAEEEDEGPSCHSCRVQARAAPRAREPRCVPQTSVEMPGVTDRRFAGRIVDYKEDEGYGFIQCPELYPHFCRDVFLHRLQVGSFGVGAWVSFGVFLNKSGQPQAKDLEALSWGGWGPFVMERQPLNPHAKPFQTRAAVAPGSAAADTYDCSSSARPEATWKRRPSSRKEGEKRWVPKASVGVPAAGSHSELQ